MKEVIQHPKITYLKAGEKVCPVCGGNHIQGISRVTGYLSLDERFGEGKVAERAARVDHNGGHVANYARDIAAVGNGSISKK